MIALDSNVVLRCLLNDDPRHSAKARALLASGERFWVPVTVVLEVAWVLESHGAVPEAVALGVRTLLGLPELTVQERDAVVRALAWQQHGMGMADALHLALSHQAVGLKTFDKDFAKAAKRMAAQPSVSAP